MVDSVKSWKRLLISLVIALITNVGIWAIVVILPAIETEFNSGRGGATLPYTLTLVGFAIGNFLIGHLVDKYGVVKALVFGTILISVSFLVSAFSFNLNLIIVAHFFLGIGTSSGFGPLISDISRWFYRKRGIAVAIIASGNYLSGVIWSPAIANIMTHTGWREVYIILALAIFVTSIPLSFFLRERKIANSFTAIEYQRLSKTPVLVISARKLQLLLGLAGVGCCIAMAMPQVHIVAYCVGLGYGSTTGAEMLSVMLAFGVASRIFFGVCSDRLGGLPTLIISSSLQMISLFFFLPFNSMASLYFVSAIFGLSQGGIVPSYAIVVREYLPEREAGRRIGIVLMLTIFGMAIGGWMSGLIFDITGDYQGAFINGILWNFFNIGILAWLFLTIGKLKVFKK